MNDVITFVLAIATFAFIAYPLLGRKRLSAAPAGDDRLQELFSERNTAYSMIKELEFDHSSGILTDQDYQDLESRYKNKAIGILKGIDEHATLATDLDTELERQVRNLRRGKKSRDTVEAELEREVRELRRAKNSGASGKAKPDVAEQVSRARGPFCPQCGEKSQGNDKFCTHCGKKLG